MNVTDVDDPWSQPNVVPAVLISLGAGLSTGLGGALVFFPEFFKKVPQSQILAVSLALSAGVMLYVSFIEIFAKSYDAIASNEGVSKVVYVDPTTTQAANPLGLLTLQSLQSDLEGLTGEKK